MRRLRKSQTTNHRKFVNYLTLIVRILKLYDDKLK